MSLSSTVINLIEQKRNREIQQEIIAKVTTDRIIEELLNTAFDHQMVFKEKPEHIMNKVTDRVSEIVEGVKKKYETI